VALAVAKKCFFRVYNETELPTKSLLVFPDKSIDPPNEYCSGKFLFFKSMIPPIA